MKKHGFMVFLGLFVAVALSFILVQRTGIFDAEDDTRIRYVNSAHIRRTVEGSFTDNKGNTIFAPTDVRKADETPIPVEYAYLLGLNDPIATTGLRNVYHDHLYADDETGKGGTVQLTTDNILQKKAYAVLKENDFSGSIIVMNVKNAEILAMASRREKDYVIMRPTAQDKEGKTEDKWYNEWKSAWSKIDGGEYDEIGNKVKSGYNDIDGFKLAPATKDFKAPGSIFKILTSAAAFMSKKEDYTYYNTGSLMVDDTPIVNHSESTTTNKTIGLSEAFIDSTNTYFATLGMYLGEGVMSDVYRRFLVGETINLGFTTLKSEANFNGREDNLALMSFGQGGVAVSPLHIAMIGQCIANNGYMLKPTVVKAMYDAHGNCVYQNNQHELLAQPIDAEIAQKVKGLMSDLTSHKEKNPEFGWRAKYTPNIYIKTGTATVDNRYTYDSYLLCMTDDYVILVSINDTTLQAKNLFNYAEKILKELY